jgi:hypothetical protein
VRRRTGDFAGAERLLRDLLKGQGAAPELHSALASVLHESGRLAEAESHALEAITAKPDDPAIVENLVVLLLASNRPREAMKYIRTWRSRLPVEQTWIAWEATAARMLGDPLYRLLCDYDRCVRVYEIEPPAGWRSTAELNAALVTVLRARHRFTAHPIDQSLRHGSQTARSLLTEESFVIRSALEAFRPPLEDYQRAIGSDASHPLSARNNGQAQFSGCWSVQLHREGFHVNHIHPRGWISSAYYVSVPEETRDADAKSGWIKFGEPHVPMPGMVPERFVQPRAGRLVLFPSYLWHGTNAIHGDEPRLTMAFDAVPGFSNGGI